LHESSRILDRAPYKEHHTTYCKASTITKQNRATTEIEFKPLSINRAIFESVTPSLQWSRNKVKLSRYMPWRHMGERRYSSYSFLTSALDRGEWSASCPGRALLPGERTTGIHWTGGWVGPRAGLDAGARRKTLCLCRVSNPGRPVRRQSLYCLSYPGSWSRNSYYYYYYYYYYNNIL
jgi:hypothetical protein